MIAAIFLWSPSQIWPSLFCVKNDVGGGIPMNVKKNLILAALAAMAMVNIADAASVVPTVTPLQFSTATTTANAVNKAGPAFTGTITGATALQAGDTITLVLSGGAKFDTVTWATEVSGAAFIADTVNNSGTVTGCSLASGSTVLICTVGVGTAGAASTINVSTAALYDLDTTTADVTLATEVTRTALSTTEVVHATAAADLANSVLLNVNATIQKGTAVTAGAGKTATVTELFKSFATGAGNLVTTATTGTASTSGDAAQAGATGAFLLKLTGLPAAATKVTIGAGGTVAGANAIATPTTATNSGDFWLDGAGSGFAFLAGTANLPTLAGLVITMDGTTPITAGTPQLAIDYRAGAADIYAGHAILAATNLTTISRNGSDIILSLVTAGTTVELINNDSAGSAAGTMLITATDAAGAAITDTGLAVNAMPATVAPGFSASILGSDLLLAFPLAARINFVIEASDVSATAVTIVPAVGANVNTIRTGADSAL